MKLNRYEIGSLVAVALMVLTMIGVLVGCTKAPDFSEPTPVPHSSVTIEEIEGTATARMYRVVDGLVTCYLAWSRNSGDIALSCLP